MDKAVFLPLIAYLYVSSLYISCSYSYPRPPIGVHPLDQKYYDSELIGCKDGSKSFTRDRLNDNFCDCADGTDEPGTSACPYGKFYCSNAGSIPRFLFSSSVNDHICDCCDGSDEYDGAVICPNICVMGGNVQTIRYASVASDADSIISQKSKPGGNKIENSSQIPGGWKALMFLQIGAVIFVLVCQLRRRKSRRRTVR